MSDQKRKKITIIIVVLAVLLAISAAALVGTLVVRYVSQREAASVEVPGNIITPDGEDSSDADKEPADGTTDPSGSTNEVDPSVTDTPDPSSSADDEKTTSETVSKPNVSETTETSSVSVTKASAISLHSKQPEENKPFQVTNMFPGDVETKYYRIKVSYKGDIIVRYHADIRPGYEKLSEVLKVRIRLPETDEALYDGLMRDMPDSLNHALYTNESTQSELYYEITAYLDASVGNEYQDKELIADFRWWVQEIEHLDSPQTGDNSHIFLWVILMISSFFCMVILLAKRRKETSDEF